MTEQRLSGQVRGIQGYPGMLGYQKPKYQCIALHTIWDVKKDTGECGCKSAAFSYLVTAAKQNRIISQGRASTLGKSGFVFLINPDSSINYKSEYILTIDCSL